MPDLGRSAVLTGFVETARGLGLDPHRLAAEAGVPREALSDTEMRVPSKAMSQLLELAAERSRTEDFGLRMAANRGMSTMGVIGLALRNQPTARRAMEMLVQYAWLQNELLRVRLEDEGEDTLLSFGMAGWTDRQGGELIMGIGFRLLRDLCGPGWRPREIRFLHAAPRSLEGCRRFFGMTPLFNQEVFGLLLDRCDLDKPSVIGDPGMAAPLNRYLEHLAAGRSATLRGQVVDLILSMLPNGGCTADRVAHRLGMDRRTLHRRLALEGTSFTEILEGARGELATTLLANSDRPMQNVAETLGFSSLSAFGHWFKRHFDCSASRYRAIGGRTRTGAGASVVTA
ncbi:AraC family transcriptional regulator [Phenylobacterium sp.]|jgi:AraC-like DNA-binding protein|uniref:AraC family transcriptional regulator n=1 Tax=Phenylobacterium sp. TaxID=1871053 RepID=UPI002F42F042